MNTGKKIGIDIGIALLVIAIGLFFYFSQRDASEMPEVAPLTDEEKAAFLDAAIERGGSSGLTDAEKKAILDAAPAPSNPLTDAQKKQILEALKANP